MSRRLVLLRHGRTTWNLERRFQGQKDVELDVVGLQQAELAAEQLALLQPERIVSSDLQRAKATAEALARRTGVSVVVDARLRETYAGAWEGLARDELQQKFGDDLAAWASGSDLQPGGGERRSEVAVRMEEAIYDALNGVSSDGTLVVVTHGGSARAVVGQLLGLSVEHWAILGVLTNCSWSVLSEQEDHPRWRLEEYNARSLPHAAFADDR